MIRFCRSNLTILMLAIACVVSITQDASAQKLLAREEVDALNGLPVDEQLGNSADLSTTFINANGQEVEFSSYFQDDKPVVLVMVYYECPVVCPVVLSQLTTSLNKLDYTAGEDYKVLVVSFDHTETTSMALGERTNFIDSYEKASQASAQDGIAFHTGDALNIRRLVNSIGFNFNPLDNGEYSHPISLMILSPKGKVTRYMYGFDYPPQELKLSLLDASQGKIATSFGDRLLHFCYKFDPLAGSYSLQAFRVMQIGAILTVILIIIGLTVLFMGERVRKKLYLAKLEAQADGQASTSDINDHDSHSSNTTSGAFAGPKTGHVS
jgi:protein SCO1